jgi:hypothetical protein
MVLRCPFCGQEPEVGRSLFSGDFKIRCLTLGCVRPEISETYRMRKRAVLAWNTRP